MTGGFKVFTTMILMFLEDKVFLKSKQIRTEQNKRTNEPVVDDNGAEIAVRKV